MDSSSIVKQNKKDEILFLLDDGWRHEKRVILDYLAARLPIHVITHDPWTYELLMANYQVTLLPVVPIAKHPFYLPALFFARELDTVVTKRERLLRLRSSGSRLQHLFHLLRELLGYLGLRRYRYEKALKWLYRRSQCYSELLGGHDVLIYSPIGVRDKRIVFEAQVAGKHIISWVYSWDNPIKDNEFISDLSAYLVWNEDNREDLWHWHGIDPSIVHVVGAAQMDPLIAMSPHERATPSAHRYVLYPCATGRDIFMKQEVGLILWLRELLDQIDPQVELLVRPYPFRKMSEGNSYDELEGRPGIRLAYFGREIHGQVVIDAADEQARLQQIQRAVCMLNLGSTIGLEAAYCDTPVIQLAFCDVPVEEGNLSLSSVFDNEHLRYLIDHDCPNVVMDKKQLEVALRDILGGNHDAYRRYSAIMRRMSDPLKVPSYKQVLYETIDRLVSQWRLSR